MASKRKNRAKDDNDSDALEEFVEAAGEDQKGVAEEDKAELRNYKVAVAAQEIDGVMRQVGDELSLSAERAEQLRTAGYHLDEV